jgi:hypothetical protein
MVINKCILCNVDSVDLGVKKVEGLNIKRTEYTIAQCPQCKLFWTKDPSDDYEWLYEGEYWHEHMDQINGWRVENKARIDNDIKWAEVRKPDIQKWFPKPRWILEIASSTGAMLNMLNGLGHYTIGVEPDDEANDLARKTFPLTEAGTILYTNAKGLPYGKFAGLIALDVIEHVLNPLEEAKMWVSKVEMGGLIWIECPDAGCEDAVANNRGPVPELEFGYLMPFEHIYQFNKENLIRLFEELGCICLWSGNVFTTDRQRCIFKKVW